MQFQNLPVVDMLILVAFWQLRNPVYYSFEIEILI